LSNYFLYISFFSLHVAWAVNLFLYRPTLFYLIMFTICCHNTDHVHVNGHDRSILVILAKYCTKLPDDGSSVIRNMLE